MKDNNTTIYKPAKRKDYTNFNLTFPEVDKLLDQIELIKRRKIKDHNTQINYIDPFNHVKTLKNQVNHLIIGRRGAGKTSLLIKVIEEIKKANGLVTVVDMQGKQRQGADLPLVEVLLQLFNDLKDNLENDELWEPYVTRKAKTKFYMLKSLCYGLVSKEIWTNENIEYDKLFNTITYILNRLDAIKHTPNGATIQIIKSSKQKQQSAKTFKILGAISADYKYLAAVNATASIESSYTVSRENENNNENNLEFSVSYSKQEALDELKQDCIKCIESFFKIFNKSIFLILDDFYQIPINNQPYIFQYLHDINKETSQMAFSYKACLVPNRFKLNEENNKILSHKDDFSTINLDREFCELEANKDLLFKILCGIDPKLGLTTTRINKLFNDTSVINDCIRASGALPRYFLDVFSHMVKFSIAENQTKIHRMVLTQVVREIKKSKDELISEEAYLPENQIRSLYGIIEEEVVHGLHTNVILYPNISFKKNEDILNSLINLGYIHRIKESIMVNKINYTPIFIDMIFTHTKSDKMPKHFKDVKFWEQNGKSLSKCQIWEFKQESINGLNHLNLDVVL
ncbi:P-loop NTPase fold protein [Flavobacterium sp. XS2P39]|uniref:P-loop NTPase fold protein n=1 Tax=Flavobacterium sp. XS2P39 TaxID=3401725 RepID=UPI003AAD4195